MYKTIFDQVVHVFSSTPYANEFHAAREEYFTRTGKVFQDEPMFESRMNAFLEWYLCDRPLYDSSIPPVRLYRLKCQEKLDPSEIEILQGLEKTLHSLFILSAVEKDHYIVEDIRTETKHRVSMIHPIPGVHRGDILDARVLTVGKDTLFSDALWVHPADASTFLVNESKKRREGDVVHWRSYLFDLAYMKLKRERYAHVPTKQIYDWKTFARDHAETGRLSAELASRE